MPAPRVVAGAVGCVIAAVSIVLFHAETWSRSTSVSIAFFAIASVVLLGFLALSARGRSFTHLPVAPGRVVAIIPAYNERPELLAASVESLLAGTVLPDVIHVVDDGSHVPATPIDHPRVRWHRQPNLGKRHAQAAALREEHNATFVLTVDSDAVVDRNALEHALRAMSEPRVQAVTATCLVRNRAAGLLTRLMDLEIVTGNAVMRRARSVLGVVAPTSGPFSLYRSGILLDNLDDYLASGTYGDDRRLTHYALLRGEVVACDESIVAMEMPASVGDALRQRTRWFQGYFTYLGWELRNLEGAALWLRLWNLVLLVAIPVVAVAAFVVVPLVTGRFPWEPIAYWIALLYAQTLQYLVGRPSMSRRSRLVAWVALTPLLVAFQWLIIRPAMLRALTRLRSSAWVTRDIAPA